MKHVMVSCAPAHRRQSLGNENMMQVVIMLLSASAMHAEALGPEGKGAVLMPLHYSALLKCWGADNPNCTYGNYPEL